ncbi:magnesium-translocating P-type ATPase [Clostridium butyricum]|uniref:magnesium-translocating P-type ATPase n=1 Tax=Clostridium butyricum TaxID=1492 RepID=UPI003D329BEF
MAKLSILNERMEKYACENVSQIYEDFNIKKQGLSDSDVENMKYRYGKNIIAVKKEDTFLFRLRRSFINPFTTILFILGIISFFTDTVLYSVKQTHSITTAPIIGIMILISGCLRFLQEVRSKNAASKLMKLVNSHVTVLRDGNFMEISADKLVVGDYIKVSAGDRIPADMRFVFTSDLFISQAVITGESSVLEKTHNNLKKGKSYSLIDYENLGFMGTTVISGKGEGIVLAVGKETLYGNFNIYNSERKSRFEISSTSIASVLIKFMIILVPLIFILIGFTKGDWIKSFLFALSVAIGLTPEMLPMVITTCLAKGSISMSKKETIVKNINAMQVFGSMDVLCIDKTGTLTNNEIVLEYFMDIIGNEDSQALDYAYLNSFYHTGAQNPVDDAILKCRNMPNHEQHFLSISEEWSKRDELPFDYNRKCVSILVEDNNENKLMVIKGDINEIADKCSFVRFNGENIKIQDDKRKNINAVVDDILEDGIKVIAVAIKNIQRDKNNITVEDEKDLILIGYLAFFDVPKKSAKEALRKLQNLSVDTKILTGDNKKVTASVCQRLGINTERIILGKELESLSEEKLNEIVEKNNVFAELTPHQKVEIILTLRDNGHIVGFMGDGVNDVPALSEADVGISVDSAVDAAKDIADVILLKKDLNVLESGILEGRKTFSNMTKYIHISASSNFGNIFSIVCACIFLPFLPMASLQLILLNLFYDIICIILPWDNVDEELYKKPNEWSGKHLSRFMLFFGSISSIFDILTFIFLYFIMCPALCDGKLFHMISDVSLQIKYMMIFQSGWFIESMWTQVLIIHMLRTKKVPFIQSTPSIPVMVVTIVGIICFTGFSYLPVANLLGLTALPLVFYCYLIFIVVSYMLITTLAKSFYIKKYKKLF